MPANFVPTLISSFFNIFKKQKEISFAWRQNQKKDSRKKIVCCISMYFWWRDVIWWWQRQTFSLLILLLKVHDCTYIYTYIYTLWHLWQIIALEMGTNNFNFFLRLYRKKKTKTKQTRARAYTLNFYVRTTYSTHIYTF